MTIVEECQKEIIELRKLGVKIPDAVFNNTEGMIENENGGMSVSDSVDLLIMLEKRI